MAFKTEKELVKKALSSQYMRGMIESESTRFAAEEVHGLFGVPDYVVTYIDREAPKPRQYVTIAFEMKLSKWKQALAQAYCYQSFANKVYVLIDDTYINTPRANLRRFKEANIGLLSINDDGVVFTYHEPKFGKPYSRRLEDALREIISP